MISLFDIDQINKFLYDSNTTLESIEKAFMNKFNPEIAYYNYFFQGLCDNIFPRQQRLIVIYLLSVSDYRYLLNEMIAYTQDHFERRLITDPSFVRNQSKTISQYAGKQIKTLLIEDDSQKDVTSPSQNSDKLRNVISQSLKPPLKILKSEKIMQLLKQNNGVEADFLRIEPQPLNLKFEWINSFSDFEVIWDYQLLIKQDKLSQIKEIIQKAHKQLLNDDEIKILQELQDTSILLKSGNFNLSELIEKNLALSYFIFTKNYQNPEFQDLMDTLASIDVTPNTLEILCMITQQYYIPPEFVNYYVNYCMNYCTNLKEKTHQTRMIRYTSLFIKYMIKEKYLKTQDLVTELQAFSIDFSRIGEASALFKLIKQNDQQQ